MVGYSYQDLYGRPKRRGPKRNELELSRARKYRHRKRRHQLEKEGRRTARRNR